MTRTSIEALERALKEAERARSCIGQNRGHDRELAREGYEYAVAEVATAFEVAFGDALGDLPERDIEAIAVMFLRRIKKAGLL